MPNDPEPRAAVLAASTIHTFRESVLAWYDANGRKDLPWQIERTPYRVWISEIMLQQTQVGTVIPFFERFVERFPDLRPLAESSLEDVLALWAGLGYYARARHLHRAACLVLERHGGALPPDGAALLALPGIGRSTAGAILSLAYGVPAPILDGNVKRVFCRHFRVGGWPGDPKVARRLWSFGEQLVPPARPGDYNQALMDLGAMVCTARRPSCPACPLTNTCSAYREGDSERLPATKPRPTLPAREAYLLLLRDGQGDIYLERRPSTGLWGGLWCFPLFPEEQALRNWCEGYAIQPLALEPLRRRRHTFSHFHLDYTPVVVRAEARSSGVAESGQALWHTPGAPPAFGLPTPIRRLLDELATTQRRSERI